MKKLYLLLSLTIAAIALTSTVQQSAAQVLVSSGSPYTQNFDTLASTGTGTWADNTTLLGWYASHSNTFASYTAYTVGTGSGTGGGLYSFGASGASDRALGSLGSGNAAVGASAYGVRFQNNTANTMGNIVVSYTGEQWRNGASAAPNLLLFSYVVSSSPITSSDATSAGQAWIPVPSLNFTNPVFAGSAGALDGNANHTTISSALVGVTVAPGQEIFFRWLDNDETGTDSGNGIDDLTIAYTAAPPSTNAPTIITNPTGSTNTAGTSVSFTAVAGGDNLTFQWFKGVAQLSDGGNIIGSSTFTLTITNLLGADAGDYLCHISNVGGATNTAAAHLKVIDPFVFSQPGSVTNVLGDTLDMFAAFAGTSPMDVFWYHGNTVVASGTSNSAIAAASSVLTLGNLQPGDGGNYTLVVSNSFGMTTSAVAVATIFPTPANRIVRWDFNAPGISLTSPAPSEGTGTASLLGTVVGSINPGSFSDPATALSQVNEAWHTTTYPAATVGNETAGVQFNVPTTGQQGIVVTWQQRHSNTASKYFRFRYTTDGSTFNEGPLLTMGVTNNSFIFYSADLSAVPAANNNANFAFQIVTAFDPATGTNYTATTPGSAYGAAGTIRFDLMSVYGNALGTVTPIPLHIQLFNTNAVLTWTDPSFNLQSSLVVTGGYSTIGSASSPYTNAATGVKFFRLMHP